MFYGQRNSLCLGHKATKADTVGRQREKDTA